MSQIVLSPEQKQSLMDARAKVIECRNSQVSLNHNIQLLTNESRRCSLVLQELSTLTEGRPTYRGVGKMFLRTPVDTLKSDLNSTSEKCASEIGRLKENVEANLTSTAEAEKELKSLYESIRSASA